MRALIVEDHPATATGLATILGSASCVCDTTDLGEEGLELGKLYDYDVVILDLMLPDIDGYDVLRRMRAACIATPTVILSGLTGLDEKVKALAAGADDYITKPFSARELVARVQAIVRRAKGHCDPVVRTGPLAVHLNARHVTVNGEPVYLTVKEYEILSLLALRKGTTVGKETILDHLYGGLDEPDIKIVDVFVCKLRKKLAKVAGGRSYIATVWGRGYLLRDEAPWPADSDIEIPAESGERTIEAA